VPPGSIFGPEYAPFNQREIAVSDVNPSNIAHLANTTVGLYVGTGNYSSGDGFVESQVKPQNDLMASRMAQAGIKYWYSQDHEASPNFGWGCDDNHDQMIKALRYDVDYSYIPTLGMKIAEGRNFSPDYGSDSSAVIVNESAIRAFGWKGSPLGHTITHSENDGVKSTYRVVGVIKDFHFKSMHEAITPLVMTMGSESTPTGFPPDATVWATWISMR